MLDNSPLTNEEKEKFISFLIHLNAIVELFNMLTNEEKIIVLTKVVNDEKFPFSISPQFLRGVLLGWYGK